MSVTGTKKLYKTFRDAERAAESMRNQFGESFSTYKVAGGWEVGGVHLKNKKPYKRVKSFSEIRALFADVDSEIGESEVTEYAELIEATSRTAKSSEVNGGGENWRLVAIETLSGRELSMNNDTSYLALTVENDAQTLKIQMGGAFSGSVPLVAAQAKSLLGRRIVWHTWNSAGDPTKWQRSKWFYMIEAVET